VIEEMLKKFPLISDQVSRAEIAIILREFAKVLDARTGGDVVEFGCYKGTTSLFLARMLAKTNSDKKLFLYDSFAGLPEKSRPDLSRVGEEFRAGELAATKKDLLKTFAKNNLTRPIVVKSWFSEIREEQLPREISFAFFDGDFYESIRDSFAKCNDKFAAGATIIVDDFANEKLPGAARAVDEWRAKNFARIANVREEKSLAIIRLK
jgi:O-methyltransferase